MTKITRALFTATLLALCPQAALAQATTFQTFVSAQRSDANACTLLAPCRTFAAAQARTTAGGIIDVLDVAATAQSPSTSLDRLPRWAREHGRMSWCCRRAPMRAAIRPASAAAIVASGLALPKLTGHPRQEALARPRTFDVTHEIAHDFDLMRVIGRDFNVSELIFDEKQQFQTIEPVGPEIVTEVRFVRDASDVNVEVLGNERANFADCQAFLTRYSLREAQAAEDHDKPPESLSGRDSIKQSVPHCDAAREFRDRGNSATLDPTGVAGQRTLAFCRTFLRSECQVFRIGCAWHPIGKTACACSPLS
jgi:hypothetical protein